MWQSEIYNFILYSNTDSLKRNQLAQGTHKFTIVLKPWQYIIARSRNNLHKSIHRHWNLKTKVKLNKDDAVLGDIIPSCISQWSANYLTKHKMYVVFRWIICTLNTMHMVDWSLILINQHRNMPKNKKK
jgi:hypothetical protein